MTFPRIDTQFVWVDIHKTFDTDIKHDVDLDLDIDIDIKKDVDVDVKGDTDLKLDLGHVAMAEAFVQNDAAPFVEVQGIVSTTTTVAGSQAIGTGIASLTIAPVDVVAVQGTANASGHATFTEVTVEIDASLLGTHGSVSSVSMTDNLPSIF
jgi:hypothetical protein